MSDRGKVTVAGLCLSAALLLATTPAALAQAGPAIETVTFPNADSPLVAVRLQFAVGSIHDPKGKEGLAALTAHMIAEAGTQSRSYQEVLEVLYPMAASISAVADREITSLSGTVHRDNLSLYTDLLKEALLKPGFSQSDFERNREQLTVFLTNSLRSNDERLGLEMIQHEIFEGHPYEHASAGTVEGLKSITLDDVKKFYKDHYTRANLMLGVAGGYPNDYVAGLQKDLAALPAGQKGKKDLPPLPKIQGRNFTLIEKQTGSTGIHLGFPIPVTRADADYYPLMVANSYLGEHRTFFGRLMVQLRGERGLNYGDYSYIEHYYNPPLTDTPTPVVPRRQQYFSVWVRPVVPEDAQFATRAALYEVQRLRDRGLTREEFEITRDYLINFSKLWAQSLDDRLGFHMESRFYGMPYFIDEIEKRLKGMTVEDVNTSIKKHIQTDNYEAVFVTGNAQQLKETLQKDASSPKTYNAQPAAEVLEADKTIQAIKIQPTRIDIVPVGQVF